MQEYLTIKNIIIYVLAINLIAFLAMWIDKRKAKKGEWRISEKALFMLVLLGRWNWRNYRNVYISS